MTHRQWSEESIRKAEFQLMDHCNGTWHEKIVCALNEALDQAEREERATRRERLLEKIRELRGQG